MKSETKALTEQEVLRLPQQTCVAVLLPQDMDLNQDGTIHPVIWGNRGKFFPKGKTLRVRFKNGDLKQQKNATERLKYIDSLCGLSFKFVTSGPAEFRVAFNRGGGHWSYVGTDNLGIPQQHQTMNIDLSGSSSKSEWDRVVIHEGLHAIGFNHEHQHPLDKIPWNKEAVYRSYGRSQGWSRAEIDRQVMNPGSANGFVGTPGLDKDSIMMYPIPKELVLDPKYASGWNTKLSSSDLEQIAKLYP